MQWKYIAEKWLFKFWFTVFKENMTTSVFDNNVVDTISFRLEQCYLLATYRYVLTLAALNSAAKLRILKSAFASIIYL
ncbi:hypothetical protein RA20_03265 [Leisingera sp. ANG-Vp]|nr:hypothetical protein RA20_03265 [Leisingera sp. ANG-Vp]